MTALAVAFLVVYAWQVLHVSAPAWWRLTLEITLWGVWLVFAADYVTRLVLAERKLRFIWRHLFDLLAVALPMVRQLRVLRLVTVLRVLNRKASTAFRGRVAIYVGMVTVLVSFAAALAVLDAERSNPDAGINSFPKALWWTLTTISTVGYGDVYPTTWEGRLVAASLMIGGIALLGVITGMIASWFLERIQQSTEESVHSETDELHVELVTLREEVRRLRAQLGEQDSSPPRVTS
ncbi:ion transporter [Kibdelosporangium phytohabitans]|uniref:Ion transporter n=2 Tax=Kibdelosporangium phytohabitans TaxID=860235 RepID=A0A0N9IIW4_9PSEU|nr:potassium channel family protein [Kibdelosporangium phytohabitans]ALG15470.1 ion transporter [Kibdelosporangium phytohabitans]